MAMFPALTHYIRNYRYGTPLACLAIGVLMCGLGLLTAGFMEDNRHLTLHLLPQAAASGAVCLDGSTPGYYYRSGKNRDFWQISFQGGSWCFDEESCYERTKTPLGTSTQWSDKMHGVGILDESCKHDPLLCDANLLYLPYCDGTSWSGNRTTPIVYKGQRLYFRGTHLLTEMLKAILTLGITDAKMIVLSGTSAGGTATEMHANVITDWLYDNVPELKKVLVLSSSGWFADLPNSNGVPVIEKEYKYLFNMAQSYIRPGTCTLSGDEQWKCFFPQYLYPNIKAPYFLVKSKMDWWSTRCILTATEAGCAENDMGHCAVDLGTCTDEQINILNKFGTEVEETLTSSTEMFHRDGNGVFLHNCKSHAMLTREYLSVIEVNGVTMDQAVVNWVQGNWLNNTSPAQNTIEECQWHNTSHPRYCNPSCGPDTVVHDTGIFHLISKFFRNHSYIAWGLVALGIGLILTLVNVYCIRKQSRTTGEGFKKIQDTPATDPSIEDTSLVLGEMAQELPECNVNTEGPS